MEGCRYCRYPRAQKRVSRDMLCTQCKKIVDWYIGKSGVARTAIARELEEDASKLNR